MGESEKPVIFKNKHGSKFEISAPVLTQMKLYAQNNSNDPETGGVLLGRFIISSDDVVVDKITIPMKGDKQSRRRFFRSAKSHQNHLQREWDESEGTCNYLGEWHTHPEPSPSPSILDILQWVKKLIFDRFDSDVLFFVIVGTKQINVWEGYRKTLIIIQLKQIRP